MNGNLPENFIFTILSGSMRKHILYTCLLLTGLLILIGGNAQMTSIDSLEKVLNKGIQKNEQVKVLVELSGLYLARNPDKAFEYSQAAVAIAQQLNDLYLLGSSYRSLGNCYSDKGNYDSCALYLKITLKYIPDDPFTYFLLGQNEWFNGDDLNSIQYYKLGEKASIKKIDLKTLAIIYYSYGEYYRYLQEDSLAQNYISLSLKILEKSTLYGDLAMAYNIQAEIYRSNGEYLKALNNYIEAAKIAYQMLDSNRIGYCLSRMGHIYCIQDEFKLAEIYLVKSLDIAEKIKSQNLELFCLKALIDMYSELGNEKKCKFYSYQCMSLGQQVGDPTTEAMAYSCLSTLFYIISQKDSAQIYADKAYFCAKKNMDYINILNAILSKLPLEFEDKKYASVILLTKEGIALAKLTVTLEPLIDLYKYQYKSYEKMGKNGDAFVSYKNFKMFEDSLHNTDISIEVKKSQLEIGYQDKHLADTLIYIENEQNTRQEILLRKQESEYFLAISVIIAVLLSVIILLVWTTSIKRKKLNLSLVESNNDKALLLKEIHHRVKNSLQIVSSLLNLQKNQIVEKNFDELINESQNRINNIAIVHELLYQSSSFNRINLQQYVDKLTRHILETFNDEKKKIEIKTIIENIEISLDKSVPLALIINEIITNAVKYAFIGKQDGIIEIYAKKIGDKIEIRISDNGIGIPDETLKEVKSGIGFTLIQGFINQLKGNLAYKNKNGVFFVFSFSEN